MYTDAQMLDLDILQLLELDIYYTLCSTILRDNQRRCDDIKLEKKFGTHSWDWCVYMIIFFVSVVDTYNVDTQSLVCEDTYHVFFCDLDE